MAFDRKTERTRAPVEGPLRRLPGQSLRDERDRLLNDHVTEYLILALGCLFLAGWEWMRRWQPVPNAAEIVTAFAVLTCAYCGFRIWRLRKDIRKLNLAEKGERRVSELLTQLRRKRYVSVDDIIGTGWNVDHVLVGPGGIFAIETKTYSIFGDGRAGVDDAGILRIGNKIAKGDPLSQARTCARSVQRILDERMQQKFEVTPVLIFPGWILKGAKAETGVVVLNDGTITDFFENQREVLSNEQITAIASHLDQAARS